MSAQVEGWDDVPHASELFGGDFFGDELMEMYTADAGLNLGDAPAPVAVVHSSTTEGGEAKGEEEAHPGVLVAMHAAAMDGGLSPMGVAAEFVPLAAGSGGELPPYPTLAPPAPAEAAAAAAPPVTSAPAARTTRAKAAAAAVAPKRPLAAPAAKASAKKPRTARSARAAAKAPAAKAPAPVASAAAKAPVGAKAQVPKTAAVPARLAPAGGIKVPAVVPKASAPATRATVGRVASSASAGHAKAPAPAAVAVAAALAARPAGAPLKKAPAPPAAAKASVPPKAKAPAGGGIAHRVAPAPRPAPVPSAALAAPPPRRLPPAPMPARPAAKPKGIGPQGSVCASTGVIRAKSEADFKDVASAAVASLVQNASAHGIKTTTHKPAAKPGETPVDVSTAHVHALTSQNWVTACAPVPPPAPDASSACDKAARNARRAALTQEERAKQNRDRNREHARNTRLRKKAYVEELKRTLAELVARRDAQEAERRRDAQREREQREVRFRVVEEFLKLRGRNEADAARWVAILEEGFALTLPATGFRQTVEGPKASSSALEQTLRGSAAVMEDAAHLAAYLQTIGPANSNSSAAQVQVVYRCDRKRFFMDGNVAFLDFAAATHGAVAKGAATEAAFRGTVRASFSPASNKLTSVDCTFDSGAFLAQVAAIASGAAEAAEARAADALLDSLQVPSIPAAAEAAAVSSDDGERSTDSGALPS